MRNRPESRRAALAPRLLERGPLVRLVLAALLVPGVAHAFPNDQAAFDFFVGKGLSDFQAAGIVGNLDQESGVDPTIAQYGGGPGRGIAQWSVGGRWDTSANDNVVAYAAAQGESATSLDLQLQFIWYELTTFGYGFAELQATTNVTDATVAFMDKYEICGTCDQTQRVAYAQQVLAAYSKPPVDPQPGGSGGSNDVGGGCNSGGGSGGLLLALAFVLRRGRL